MKRVLWIVVLLTLGACRPSPPIVVPPDPPPVVDPIPEPTPVPDPPAPPRRPTRGDVLNYCGLLANIFDGEGRIIWSPALPGAPADVRRAWLDQLAEAGACHVPIGPFSEGPAYPGVAWANPNWETDADAIRRLVLDILETPSRRGHGMVPVLFLDSGGRDPRPRLERVMPTVVQALEGLWESVIVVMAWEPVVGDWRSADVSWSLQRWDVLSGGRSIVGYHGSPARLVGSSNPVESDDPWQGGESVFYKTHGGETIDIALYQTPHGRELYEDCDVASDDCWLNRWNDYVLRIGGGLNGWRVLPLVLWETCAYERFRNQVTDEQCREVARRGKRVADAAGVVVGYGNGWP